MHKYLDVNWFSLIVDHFEGMGSIPVHVPVAIGCSSVGEQERNLMGGFRPQCNEIPEHVWIFQVSRRVPLLGVDKTWKQNWVTEEENGRVVSNQIPVAFLCVMFDSESPGITSRVGRSGFATHCTKSDSEWSLLADLLKDGRLQSDE